MITYSDNKFCSFVDLISKYLPPTWKSQLMTFWYQPNDKRQVVVNYPSIQPPLPFYDYHYWFVQLVVFARDQVAIKDRGSTKETNMRIQKAYIKARAVFDLPGGVHALPIDTIYRLVELLHVCPGDNSWDIGCGNNCLSSAFSAAAFGGVVICTDIGTYQLNIKYYVKSFILIPFCNDCSICAGFAVRNSKCLETGIHFKTKTA
jgi:hypothetical protein